MSDIIYLTKERVLAIESELQVLKGKGRRDIAQKIADARAHGDLSENADYDAAKDAQGLLELKISKLSEMLSKAQIIRPEEFPDDKVYILSKVKVKNLKLNKESVYIMVSAEEADYEENKIAVSSPLGKALMGRKIGDITEINVPAGITKFEILEISKAF